MLKPMATFDELFPADTVFAPRSSGEQMRWVFDDAESRVDTATGYTIAVMGGMPLICHESVAMPVAIDFFHRAGIDLPGRLLTYRSREEFAQLARECVERGQRLAYAYPPLPELGEADGLLNSVALYNWLNDKQNLDALVPTEFLAERASLLPSELEHLSGVFPEQAIFVKACHPGASGAGTDVRYCLDSVARNDAVDWLASRAEILSCVRVEREVLLEHSWCLNLSILDEGVRYLGAAIQLFSSPAKQSGSRIDMANPPPVEAIELARQIAEGAASLGYRGIVGFDIGLANDGRLVVFDLNFRIAASTPLVLLHDAACSRLGATISQTWSARPDMPLEQALARVACFADAGAFVPFRLVQTSELSGGGCSITGMLVGKSILEIEELAKEMQSSLVD